MVEAHFRFYGELNDLLPPQRRGGEYVTRITLRSGVKDAVEAQGVPHPEVAMLQVNGRAANWSHLVEAGDRITAWPYSRDLPLPPEHRLAPPPPDPPPFLLDVHLGRLASYLWLLGFDAAYRSEDPGDAALAARAAGEQRVLLSCDRRLLMHSAVTWGRVLRSRDSRRQVEEVLDRWELRRHARPFTRCMACGGELERASEMHVRRDAPPLVRRRYGLDTRHYRACTRCGRLYWPGTHTDRMESLLRRWEVPPPERPFA